MSPVDGNRLGPTRIRDLAAIGVAALVVAYLLTRFNYGSLPVVPRLAGVTAAVLGIGEAVAGYGLRSRIRESTRTDGRAPERPPVPPLTAARALMVAKASALAGAALIGLWLGFGLYVAPESSRVAVAGADTVTAAIGLVCAGVLLAGALYLESCCRTPDDRPPGAPQGG